MQRYSALELSEYLKTHQPRLIDVRELWEFERCRLENSELLPMGQLVVQGPAENFKKRNHIITPYIYDNMIFTFDIFYRPL